MNFKMGIFQTSPGSSFLDFVDSSNLGVNCGLDVLVRCGREVQQQEEHMRKTAALVLCLVLAASPALAQGMGGATRAAIADPTIRAAQARVPLADGPKNADHARVGDKKFVSASCFPTWQPSP